VWIHRAVTKSFLGCCRLRLLCTSLTSQIDLYERHTKIWMKWYGTGAPFCPLHFLAPPLIYERGALMRS
jgi:hypothetical protein